MRLPAHRVQVELLFCLKALPPLEDVWLGESAYGRIGCDVLCFRDPDLNVLMVLSIASRLPRCWYDNAHSMNPAKQRVS